MSLILRLLFILFLFPIFGFSTAHAANNGFCDDLNSDGIIEDDAVGGGYKCFVDMAGAKVHFYGIYICENAPTLSTYRDNCAEIYSTEAGTEVEFAPNTETALPLNKTLSIAPGTYQHFVMRIGSKIQDKMSVQFSSAKRGGTGEGVYCWSTNSEYVKSNRFLTNSATECSNTPPSAAGWSFQNAAYRCNGNDLAVSSTSTHGATGKTQTNHVVDTSDTHYTYSTALVNGCPRDVATWADFAPRQIIFQPLGTAAVISPTTTSIEISMGIKGYGRVQMADGANSRCGGAGVDCVIALRSKAPDFIVTTR